MKSGVEGITFPLVSDQPLDRDRITKLVSSIFADDLHAKRVASLAVATVGVLEGAALGIHAIGNALAVVEGLDSKHAVKQVDHMLSNGGIEVWQLVASWVPFVVGDRPKVGTALDRTYYDADDQSTITLSMITSHGRATLVLWKSVTKSELRGWRNEHEDVVLECLREVLPEGVMASVLADRGFGDQTLCELLKDQRDVDFVVHFRGVVKVTTADGETKDAKDWTPATGRSLLLRGARVTRAGRELGAVVCAKAKGMKEAWHLATSHGDKPTSEIVALYGKRFTIEETIRDQKNLRFGMGLSETRIGDPARRDRLLLISALAVVLLSILGAAGEAIGIDNGLKTNTVKHRTISFVRRGLMHYAVLPKMKFERFEPLMVKFGEMLRAQRVFRKMLGLIWGMAQPVTTISI